MLQICLGESVCCITLSSIVAGNYTETRIVTGYLEWKFPILKPYGILVMLGLGFIWPGGI